MQLTELMGGRVLELVVSGKLEHADYEFFVPAAEKLIEKHGRLNMLLLLEEFQGWSPRALWDDLKFDLRHFRHFERIAIVGERKWQEWLADISRPFTDAEVRFFTHEELDAARSWVREPHQPEPESDA